MALNSSKGSILIIDDSILNIELLSDILIDDYEVLYARSGKEALQVLNRIVPDLILLDIVMPEMDGYELIQLLKNNKTTAPVPVIFITAKSTTDDMVKGFRMGAVDYISKPFAVEEVKVRVKTQIENQLLLKALKKANQRLQELNRVDGLTGIANRRYFDEFLQLMLNRAKRQAKPISLLLVDIDFFKSYNDYYGHQEGDSCLQKVAGTLAQHAQRGGELAARYGGEEFALIISELSAEQARDHAHKCLQAIENLCIEHKRSNCNDYVTISVGMVTLNNSIEMTLENIIKKADVALYKAKECGRNQVQL